MSVSFAGLLSGCNGPDNPKIVDAPPPPAPKPEETVPHMIKAGEKKVEYGSNSKYKKAMERVGR